MNQVDPLLHRKLQEVGNLVSHLGEQVRQVSGQVSRRRHPPAAGTDRTPAAPHRLPRLRAAGGARLRRPAGGDQDRRHQGRPGPRVRPPQDGPQDRRRHAPGVRHRARHRGDRARGQRGADDPDPPLLARPRPRRPRLLGRRRPHALLPRRRRGVPPLPGPHLAPVHPGAALGRAARRPPTAGCATTCSPRTRRRSAGSSPSSSKHSPRAPSARPGASCSPPPSTSGSAPSSTTRPPATGRSPCGAPRSTPWPPPPPGPTTPVSPSSPRSGRSSTRSSARPAPSRPSWTATGR